MEVIYTLKYHPFVRRDIKKLGSKDREHIRRDIEQKLGTRPEVFGVPLRRSPKGYRKLRAGDYRIVFRVDKDVVFVPAVCHRRVVYQGAEKR